MSVTCLGFQEQLEDHRLGQFFCINDLLHEFRFYASFHLFVLQVLRHEIVVAPKAPKGSNLGLSNPC